MKLKTLTLATLFLTPALLAFQPKAASLRFAPEEGDARTKTFSSSLDMSLDDMAMLMNGQESPMQPDLQLDISATTEIQVTDEYVKMRDGSPAQLERTYDSLEQGQDISMEIDIMDNVQSNEMSVGAESELEGETVVFRWDEDKGEFVAAFPDDGGDEELLVGLREDMDLRGLLPDGEVEEGDEWQIAPIALRDVLSPGGDLKMIPEEVDPEAMFGGMSPEMGSADDWFNEDMEGEVKATFQGTRETDDGVMVGVVVYAIEISNGVDLTEKTREGLEDQELPPGVEDMSVNSTDIEITIESEATLLWNLEGGYVHSFEMSGDFGFLVDSSMDISAQGMELEIEQAMEFSGTMNASVSVD